MTVSRLGGGGLAGAALLALASVAQGESLCATRLEDQVRLGCLTIESGARWSVVWNHSVDGYEVEDIYENRNGAMVLVRSHLPDFGAGLGHIPGRGRQVSDGQGGYWIEDIDEPVPGNAYILRPGAGPVNHRLRARSGEILLSALAEHARVSIALLPETE
ncbi:DUF1850 domain-containing protein [Pararhodobacter marinus]|uniref:DUF1850 domain-containing protein n=1 Tax=Pararhodobacter marinus TaxID=2184063 RepID=UPI003510ED89